MKTIVKVLVIALLISSFYFVHAQSGYIDSLYILPQNPINNTPVSVVCESYFTSGDCAMVSSKVDFNDKTIDVEAIHIVGPLTYICHSIDTIEIGTLQPGDYTLIYHLQDSLWGGGVNETIDTLYFSVQPTSIQEYGDLTFFNIFPNPVSEILTINLLHNQPGFYIIYDSFGKQIQANQISDINTQVNLSHVAKGVFYVEVTSGSDRGVRRFIKH